MDCLFQRLKIKKISFALFSTLLMVYPSISMAQKSKPAAKSNTLKKKSTAPKKRTQPSTQDPFAESEPKLKKHSVVKAETPADASQKKFELLLNLGLAPSPLLGFGVTGGYFLSPTLALEGYFGTASGKIEPVAVSYTAFGARLRKSFGSVPYIAGGLAMRMVSGKWNTLSPDESQEYESGASSNAIALDLAAGAQFKLGSILLGADVVGIMFPALKMSNTEQTPEEDFSQSDFDEQKAKYEKVNGMNLILFKAGVGIAF